MSRRRNNFDEFNPRDLPPLANAFMRLGSQARLAVVGLLLALGIVAAVVYYRSQHAIQTTHSTTGIGLPLSENALLGNPSGATADASNKSNYLMVKPNYVLAWNDGLGTPIWVSWRLQREDLGRAPRKQTFDPDDTLPSGFKRVLTSYYSSTGFDRGHMCPAGDRTATQDKCFSTFVMTNIIPQAPNVNRKAWEQLESYCRELVRRHQHLYIIAGPDGKGGRGSRGFAQSIANASVTVPAECWKIVVVVPEAGDEDELRKITSTTRVIAVAMPNDNDAVGEAWAQFRTSPAEIERRTGLKFFATLPGDVAQALRQKVDEVSIPPPRPRTQDTE